MKPAARQIEVTAIGGRDFGVLVDGVQWCIVKHEPRGMHGASYTFHYHAQSDPITEKGSYVVLWSDRYWLSSLGFHGSGGMAKHRATYEGKYKTIQERIAKEAARLIKKKLIVSPEELTARREAQAAITLRKREEFEAAARKRLDERARKLIRAFGGGLSKADRNRLGFLVVEAMEWARSNT